MTDAPSRLILAVTFEPRDGWNLKHHADALSAPDATAPYLDRAAMHAQYVDLAPTDRQQVVDWFAKHAITPLPAHEQPSTPQLMLFEGTLDAFVDGFGPRARDAFGDDGFTDRPRRVDWTLPAAVRGFVQAIQALRAADAISWLQGGHWDTGATPAARAPTSSTLAGAVPEGLGGVTPAQLRRFYDFPDDLDGEGETIALLLLDAAPDAASCATFWRAHGIDRTPCEVVYVGPRPARAPSTDETLEAAMATQWAGAMAPKARLVAYVMDRSAVADKWAAFLMSIVEDTAHAPTVASTSWLIAERDYYAAFGSRVISGLLDQCAALGVTILSAAGDWGAFDGVPRLTHDGKTVADTPWPRAVFPACEERVLSVGGTMITHHEPLTEVAWSSPLPPGMAGNSPFGRLAGGGGFSDAVPIPAYQSFFETAGRKRRFFTRGPHAPATFAYGRGIPDVALMAVGRTLHRGPTEDLTVDGYQAVVGGAFIDHAGGTSTGAPIWAAIIALANQARRRAGLRRLGFCNPSLYALAAATGDPPFRDVRLGRTDVTVRTVNREGDGVDFELPGYDARIGWDPVTGLGVPRVATLVSRLCDLGPSPQISETEPQKAEP